ERYVLAIAPDDLPRFAEIANRERCPYAVVGVATEERQLRVTIGEGLPGVTAETRPKKDDEIRPVDLPIDVVLGKTPKMLRDVTRKPPVQGSMDLTQI